MCILNLIACFTYTLNLLTEHSLLMKATSTANIWKSNAGFLTYDYM